MTLHLSHSVALISLPGARLPELAALLADSIDLPVASTLELTEGRRAIFLLPSDFVEAGGETRLQVFRVQGNLVIYLDLSWEESWRAMNPENLADPNGLPWRTSYRALAKERRERLLKVSDIQVPATGTLAQVAAATQTALAQFER